MSTRAFTAFLDQSRSPHADAAGGCVPEQDLATPVALHQLLTRLLDDHQRMAPHHADLCPLCHDAARALAVLADELPAGERVGHA